MSKRDVIYSFLFFYSPSLCTCDFRSDLFYYARERSEIVRRKLWAARAKWSQRAISISRFGRANLALEGRTRTNVAKLLHADTRIWRNCAKGKYIRARVRECVDDGMKLGTRNKGQWRNFLLNYYSITTYIAFRCVRKTVEGGSISKLYCSKSPSRADHYRISWTHDQSL